jgi:hypothetical protein
MKSSAGLMIMLLVFAAGAIGGLWFYLHPGLEKDLISKASSDLADIDTNLNALENATARLKAASVPSGTANNSALFQGGGKAEMVMDSLGRQKCKDVLQRMLSNGRTVRLNGQPAQSAQGCRSADNRIEVLL